MLSLSASVQRTGPSEPRKGLNHLPFFYENASAETVPRRLLAAKAELEKGSLRPACLYESGCHKAITRKLSFLTTLWVNLMYLTATSHRMTLAVLRERAGGGYICLLSFSDTTHGVGFCW